MTHPSCSDLVSTDEPSLTAVGLLGPVESGWRDSSAAPDYLSDEAIDFLCRIWPGAMPPSERRGAATQLIGACAGCQRDLPWQTPLAGFAASPIACPQCGRWYFTRGGSETPPSVEQPPIDQVGRPRGVFRAMFTLRQAETVSDLINTLLGPERYVDEERRRSPRHDCTLPVVVVPLDREARPTGNAFDTTMISLSIGGVAIIGAEEVDADLLLLDFSRAGAPGHQTMARIAWSETKEGYTKIGCNFLSTSKADAPVS